MNNNKVKGCKDFMAMPKKLAKWIKDNYTYVVVAGDSEPPRGNWIDCHAKGDSLLHGRFLIDTEQKMWRFPSEAEAEMNLNVMVDEISNWVIDYRYQLYRKDLCGYVHAKIRVMDSGVKTKEIFEGLSREEDKAIARSLIEKVASPCDGYDEDFDNPNSDFYFKFEFKKDRVYFNTMFRMSV